MQNVMQALYLTRNARGLPASARRYITRPDFVAYKYEDRNCLAPRLCRSLWGIQEVSWTLRRREDLLCAERAHAIGIFERFDPDRN